jgi:hypothetical protein
MILTCLHHHMPQFIFPCLGCPCLQLIPQQTQNLRTQETPLLLPCQEFAQSGACPKTHSTARVAFQVPLRETGGPTWYNPNGELQGGGPLFIYQPFTTMDLLNWKNHTPLYTEKLQAMVDSVCHPNS